MISLVTLGPVGLKEGQHVSQPQEGLCPEEACFLPLGVTCCYDNRSPMLGSEQCQVALCWGRRV